LALVTFKLPLNFVMAAKKNFGILTVLMPTFDRKRRAASQASLTVLDSLKSRSMKTELERVIHSPPLASVQKTAASRKRLL
jgi:hypothetical protein